MPSHLPKGFALLSSAAIVALASPAMAQSIDYGDVSDADTGASAASPSSGDSSAAPSGRERASRGGRRGSGGGKRVEIRPYIEAAQVATARFTPGNEVLTFSVLAAGVDANVQGRNNALSASVRYQHDFGWGRNANTGNQLTGLARGYTTILPGVQIDAGVLGVRSRVQSGGALVRDVFGDRSAETRIYSAYAGPSVSTHIGDIAVGGNYRFGYSRAEAPDAFVTPAGTLGDVFDDSTVHSAELRAGVKPGTVLPVGIGAGAGYYREDVSNLDQRVEDFHARVDVTVPITSTLAAVGGIGYEDVTVSGRDALRDAAGNPVIGDNGRYVTDRAAPRQIAYDTSGLIWDAGVLWRPGRRTSLEAHVGRRYGSTSYFGSFSYAPTDRSSVNVSVYDSIAGFGGRLNQALVALPTDFDAFRNPLTGDISGCVSAQAQNGCVTGALGSVRSAVFRARGVMATYALNLGRLTTGVGGGYDRRRFIGAPGTILASASGLIDENYWLEAYLAGQMGRNASFRANVYANWYNQGGTATDSSVIGASASYIRNLTERLSATAALGINSITQEQPLPDQVTGSALLGLTYSF